MKYLSFKSFMRLYEYSFQCQNFSIKILNKLFFERLYDDSYYTIRNYFPIHHDRNGLLVVLMLLEEVLNNKINESEELFPAYEDYALTILNKLFTSKNDRNKMIDFLNHNITELLTEHNIKILYDKFHSRFGNSSDNEHFMLNFK